MSLELDVATKLHERLTQEIDASSGSLRRALSFEKYQQACGMIVAWEMVRDTWLPEIVQELSEK